MTFDISQYQGLTVFVLGLLLGVAGLALRAHILATVEARIVAASAQPALKSVHERVETHEARLASIETAMRHLPTAEQMSALNLMVADLRGEVRALGVAVQGVEKTVNSTGRRLELIDEHLKRGG
jgi:hypothetical protein